jgi:PAS domain S-box-containing protein
MTFGAGSASPKLRFVVVLAAFATLYFLVAVLTGSLVGDPGIAVVWPASGVYLGVMLVAPRRAWSALACAAAVGSVAAYLHGGSSLQVSVAFAVPSSAEGLLGALLVERIARKRFALSGLRDLLALVVGGAVVATALVGLSAGAVAAQTFGASFGESWLRWWSADALGVLAIAPIITAPRRTGLSRGEAGYAMCVLAGAGLAVLWEPSAAVTMAAAAIALPGLLWAGWRWGPPAAALGGAGVAVAALHVASQILILQAFLAVLMLGSLAFAVAIGHGRLEQAAASKSRRRLRQVVDASPDAYLAVDAGGRVVDWSASAQALFGWDAQQAVGRSLTETIGPGAAPATPTPATRDFALIARHRDGRTFPVTLTVRPGYEGDDDVCHIFARDLTESERLGDARDEARHELEGTAEELERAGLRIAQLTAELTARRTELDAAGRRSAQLAEHLRDARAAGTRTDGELHDARRALTAAEQDLRRLGREHAAAASDRDRGRRELDDSVRELGRVEAELERTQDALERTQQALERTQQAHSQTAHSLEQARERFADERERLERSLADATTRLAAADAERRLLGEHATELISRYDERGICLFASPASRRMLGYEPEELVGRPGAELLHPHDRARLLRARATGTETTFEARLQRKDGGFALVEVTLHPVLRDEHARPLELTTTVREISEERRGDQRRRVAETRFHSLFGTLPTGSALLSPDGRIEKANLALCRLTGRSREQLEGIPLATLLRGEDAALFSIDLRRVARGEVVTLRLDQQLVQAGGGAVQVEVAVTPLPAADGAELNGTLPRHGLVAHFQVRRERVRAHDEVRQLTPGHAA